MFYGWIVVWSAFACLAVIFGTAYSFAAFFAPLASEFSAQRADVSWVFGLSSLLYFSLGAVGGALSDRVGPRATSVAGILLLAGGLFASSFAPDLRTVYIAYGLGIGLGVALVYTPSMGAVQPWFTRRRGLASGIASAGIGAGTLVVPVLATWLIDAAGWRSGMRWMALGALAVGLAAAWFLDRDPARRGLGPEGAEAMPGSTAARTLVPGLGLREAVRTPQFRWMYLSTLTAGVPMFVPFAHLSASARDRGIGDTEAVALVGLIGVGSLVGRFAVGALADRFGRLPTRVLAEAALGLSLLIWAFSSGYAGFAAFAVVFGLSYGGIVSLLPPICSDLFGVKAVSGIIGLLYTGAAFGALAGPVLAGALFDRTGEYHVAIAACIAFSALAAFSAWRVMRLAAASAKG